MKRTAKFLVIAAVALSTSFLGSTAFAQHGGGGFSGGFHGGGGGGGWHGGGGWGWRGWYPWGFSFYYAPSPYYYYPYYYYPPATYAPTYAPTYYSPPAVYSSQATYDDNSPPPDPKIIDVAPQPSNDRPLSPTAVDRDSPPPTQAPPPPPPPSLRRTGQPTTVADVKALASAGLSDEVILSHIRGSQAVYHLNTAEIIDLKKSGVSDKVIDFMINTASGPR
jgi:hypothetical protein